MSLANGSYLLEFLLVVAESDLSEIAAIVCCA